MISEQSLFCVGTVKVKQSVKDPLASFGPTLLDDGDYLLSP